MIQGTETSLDGPVRTSFLVSPDGRYVSWGVPGYSQDGEEITRLMICKSDGTNHREIQTVPDRRDHVLWLGNDRIICSARRSTDYAVVALDGTKLPDMTLPNGCDILYKRLSPDGRMVAFVGSGPVSDTSLGHGLFVVELATGRVRRLIDKALKTAPAWSADSRKLAIGNSPGYARYYPLIIVDVQTGQISPAQVEGVGAAWSPDGQCLAFTTQVVRGGGWRYGIPMDGRIGIFNLTTGKLIAASPPGRNDRDRQTGKYDTAGSLLPVWSPDGQWMAYLRTASFRADKESPMKESKELWIVDKQGRRSRRILDEFYPVAWAHDSRSLFILKEHQIDRVDTESLTAQTLVSWGKAEPPEPSPADAIAIEKPGVAVRVTRIDRVYGEAFAAILCEARREYEDTFGLSLPETIVLEAKREPQGNLSLWTDGDSCLFLTISSKRQLAPSPRTGIFNIYGLCHELGHMVMYRRMKNQVGLPDGVGEGWAHYGGSVVVDAVADRLGQSIWPEPYDVAAVEGTARLKRQIEGKKWEELDPTGRAAKVFYEMDKRFGRQVLAKAFDLALTARPAGHEFMPIFVAGLREITGNPAAADWIPQEVLQPETKWKVKDRQIDDNCFDDLKVLSDETGALLYYDDGMAEGKLSSSGSGHAVLFQRPQGAWFLDRIDVLGARYGTAEPPKEDFAIYVCNDQFEPLHEFSRPYRLFQRGENQWFTISIDPVKIPQRFFICLFFNPTYTKGVYVAYDKSVERSHSRAALPYTHVYDVKEKYDWMIRVHLRQGGKAKEAIRYDLNVKE